MTLGERIYQLRTEKNLSQGTLADMLNVSRQSISKWETDSSIPDLDKLVKLGDIFSVTLDELILGKKPDSSHDNTQTMSHDRKQASGLPPRKMAGTILLCMGFLVTLVLLEAGEWALIYASPFVLCGIVCFLFRKNAGLWCAWTAFLVINAFLYYATTFNGVITLHRLLFGWKRNAAWSFILLWVKFICTIFLIAITTVRFGKLKANLTRKRLYLLVVGWVLFIIASIFIHLVVYSLSSLLWGIYFKVIYLGRFVLITVLSVQTLRYIRCKRPQIEQQ